ncbi:DUF3800 domain-containing protein [Rothia sp. ZJ932]|uniref:DUF3800 domain-containing protein n=1 Tax=Rothia sp. ZJ932 TaxID=2810516 RepID=UPI001967452D|nr:DUF3800 domain-containing protein [Rothia sp. ZJ932]QRZ61813.1 DUF3800 domain-containing protein [Rothia sp. ZJ932]
MHYYYLAEEHSFKSCDCSLTKRCSTRSSSDMEEIFAFIDESERDKTHYFMGAVIASASQVQQITAAMDSIMEEFSQRFSSLTPNTEFHGSEMMNGYGPWKKVAIRAKLAMFRRVFTAIHEAGARVFVEGIHYAQLHPVANAHLSPRERAFSHLFEQINHYGTPDNLLQVIADEHHSAETSRSNFSRYRTEGTYGYKPNRLEGINPELRFVDSQNHRLLQASDMVTYIFNRLRTVVESDKRAGLEKRKLWDIFDHSRLIYSPSEGRGRIWPR